MLNNIDLHIYLVQRICLHILELSRSVYVGDVFIIDRYDYIYSMMNLTVSGLRMNGPGSDDAL